MKLFGKLIATDTSDVSGRQVLVWVTTATSQQEFSEEDFPKPYELVGEASTSDEGSFSVEIADHENQNLTKARLSIAGEDGAPSPLMLHEMKLQEQQLVLVDGLSSKPTTAADTSTDECAFRLRPYEAIRQQRYIHLARIGNFEGKPPKVKKYSILPAPKISDGEIENLKEALKNGETSEVEQAIASAGLTSDNSFLASLVGLDVNVVQTGVAVIPAQLQRFGPRNGPNKDAEPEPDVKEEGPGGVESTSDAGVETATQAHQMQVASMSLLNADSSKMIAAHAAMGAQFASPTLEYSVGHAADFAMANTLAILNQLSADQQPNDPDARYELTCDQPLDWDVTPTIAQICEPHIYHVLEYTQEIVHAGYQQGPIVGTATLLPCQEKQIATVTWRRGEENSRRETLSARDRLTNTLARARDIEDIQSATVREASRGTSTAKTASVGASVAVPIGPALVGVTGGLSKSTSTASQNSRRDMSARASQRLRDSTRQAAESIRSQSVTVVHAVNQEEEVSATTEVIKNYNKTRTLNMITSEIYAAYDSRERLSDARVAIGVPLNMTMFTHERALAWREALEMALRKPELRLGFDAIERIQEAYQNSSLPNGAMADAEITDITGILEVEFRFAMPTGLLSDFEDADKLFNHVVSQSPFFSASTRQVIYSRLLRQWIAQNERKEEYFYSNVAPQLARDLVKLFVVKGERSDKTEIDLRLDPTALTRMGKQGRMTLSFNLGEALSGVTRRDIARLKVQLAEGTSERSVDELLPAGSEIIVHGGEFNYLTRFSSGQLFRNYRIWNDLSERDGVYIGTPLNTQELVNPLQEDIRNRNRLLQELNTNITYYHEAIFDFMAAFQPSKLRMLLDRVEIPGTNGDKTVRDVMGDYIGAIDGCVVFYVSPGHDLSKGLLEDGNDGFGTDEDLLDYYVSEYVEREPLRIAVPTGTTYTETYLGNCVLREKTDHSLAVDWSAPCDSAPTPINPVSTDSRRSEPADLTAKDFSQPIINLQNAPEAPGYSGTDAVVGAIANPDIFKDLTGLDANQANAISAFRTAMASADGARSDALKLKLAQMASKQQNMQAVDKIAANLDTYDGLPGIDDNFKKEVLQSQIREAVRPMPEPTSYSSDEYRRLDPMTRLEHDLSKMKSIERGGLADYSALVPIRDQIIEDALGSTSKGRPPNDGAFLHLSVSEPFSPSSNTTTIHHVFCKRIDSSHGPAYEVSRLNEVFGLNADLEDFYNANKRFYPNKPFSELTPEDYRHLNMNKYTDSGKNNYACLYYDQDVVRTSVKTEVPPNIFSVEAGGKTYGFEVEVEGFIGGEVEVLLAAGADDLAKVYGGVSFSAQGTITFNRRGVDVKGEAKIDAIGGTDFIYQNRETAYTLWSTDTAAVGSSQTEYSFEIDQNRFGQNASSEFTFSEIGDTLMASASLQSGTPEFEKDFPIPALAGLVRVEVNARASFGVKVNVKAFEIASPLEPKFHFEYDTLPMRIAVPSNPSRMDLKLSRKFSY